MSKVNSEKNSIKLAVIEEEEIMGKIIDNRPAFWRIYVVILLFILVTIITLGILNYNNAVNKIKEEYNDNNINMLEKAKTAVDIVINTSFHLTNQVYGDTKFLGIIRNSYGMGILDRQAVLSRLEQIKDSCQYIESASLYLSENKMVFCTDYGITYIDDYPDKSLLLDNIEMESSIKMVNSRVRIRYLSQINGSRSRIKVISLLKKIPLTASKNAILSVNFDADKIYNSVIKKLNKDEGTEVMVIGNNGKIIFGNQTSTLLQGITKDLKYKTLEDLSGKTSEIVLDNKKYMIAGVYSNILDSNFIWISSFKTLYEVFASIGSINFLYSIVLFIVLIITAIYISRRTTKPVDELINITSISKSTDRKRENIFCLMNRFVREMISNNYQLQEKVNKMVPVYKERFLFGLLNWSELSEDKITDRMQEYNIEFKNRFFYVITVEILNLYELMEKNTNLNIVKVIIQEIMERSFNENSIIANYINIDEKRIAIILNLDDQDKGKNSEKIMNLLISISNKVYVNLQIKLEFGVSNCSDSIAGLGILFKESIKALKYRLLEGTNNITFINEIVQSENHIDKEYIQNLEEKINFLLQSNKKDQAQKLMTEALHMYSDKKNIKAIDFQFRIVHLLSLLHRIGLNSNISIYEEINEEEDLSSTLSKLKTYNDAGKFFCQLINSLFKKINSEKLNPENFYYDRIIKYLDEHYKENISVDTLARSINVSHSYVFKTLREMKNDSFTEYIAKKRVEEACILLKTDMKIQDIAGIIGYSSVNYFIQVFKKYKGCTPNEMKKLLSVSS